MGADFLRDNTGLAYLSEETLYFLVRAHGRAAAGGWPDRGDDRANLKIEAAGLVDETGDFRVTAVDIEMRGREEQVEAVKLDAAHLRFRRHVEHRIEIYEGLVRVRTLTHHAGPGRVVELWPVVRLICHLSSL